jgi:hypothetical protein
MGGCLDGLRVRREHGAASGRGLRSRRLTSWSLFRLAPNIAAILIGFALLKWRAQMVDSSWQSSSSPEP